MTKLKLQSIIVIFIVVDHYVYGQEPLRIYRGNYNTFDNPTCSEYGCNNCTAVNAYCTGSDTLSRCLQCTCFGQYKTYLRYFGRCVRDNRLLFFPAFGCNEFTNPTSSMLVLDTNYQRQGEQQIADLPGTRKCFVSPNQLQFLDYCNWEQLEFNETIFVIYNRTSGTFLKWDLTRAPSNWTNLIIRLNFKCIIGSDINSKCVLIKLKRWSDSVQTTKSAPGTPTEPTYYTDVTNAKTKAVQTTKSAPGTPTEPTYYTDVTNAKTKAVYRRSKVLLEHLQNPLIILMLLMPKQKLYRRPKVLLEHLQYTLIIILTLTNAKTKALSTAESSPGTTNAKTKAVQTTESAPTTNAETKEKSTNSIAMFFVGGAVTLAIELVVLVVIFIIYKRRRQAPKLSTGVLAVEMQNQSPGEPSQNNQGQGYVIPVGETTPAELEYVNPIDGTTPVELEYVTPIDDGTTPVELEYVTPIDDGTTPVELEYVTPIDDGTTPVELEYVTPIDDGTTPVELEYVTPIDDGTTPVELEYVTPIDDGTTPVELEYVTPIDDGTAPYEEVQISPPSVYAELNRNQRDGNDNLYQELLKHDSDYVIPAHTEAESSYEEVGKIKTPPGYTELDITKRVQDDSAYYQKLIKK